MGVRRPRRSRRRGRLVGALDAEGKPIANTWQGIFPVYNTNDDGYAGAAPVGCFKPNGYSIYDMIGDVWEWTTDWYRPGHAGGSDQSERPRIARSGVDRRPIAKPRHQGRLLPVGFQRLRAISSAGAAAAASRPQRGARWLSRGAQSSARGDILVKRLALWNEGYAPAPRRSPNRAI